MAQTNKTKQNCKALRNKDEISSGACLTGFEPKSLTSYVYELGQVAQLP